MEIAADCVINGKILTYDESMKIGALKMAQWKDEQFTEQNKDKKWIYEKDYNDQLDINYQQGYIKGKQDLFEKINKALIEWAGKHTANKGGSVSQRKQLAFEVLDCVKKALEE